MDGAPTLCLNEYLDMFQMIFVNSACLDVYLLVINQRISDRPLRPSVECGILITGSSHNTTKGKLAEFGCQAGILCSPAEVNQQTDSSGFI
jgi:hypothetical protein